MAYFKSSGFFCLFFVFIFWFLSITCTMFITNSQISTIAIYLCLAVISIVYLVLCGSNIRQRLRLHKVNLLSLFLILILSAAIRPLTGFVSLLSNMFFRDMVSSSVTSELSYGLGIVLISTALLPGIVEELIFRGIIYSGMRKADPIKGILLSSLFFGLAHMNFQQFCYAFVLGIILGVLLEATDSLYSTMLLHGVFNGTSLVLTYMMTRIPSLSGMTSEETVQVSMSSTLGTLAALLPFAVASLIISVLLIMAIAHLNGRLGYLKTWFSPRIRRTWPKEKAASASYFVAVGICVFFAAATELLMYFA
ncbi:MAG TPA: CPBP family intramembrane metalloprotease [Candidatus Anaerostipes avistercoris]|uniref:CPBP family intramembrane metalloprotease n=1 Tax=Candidatus Anaerostipes avistercoris TaxID=2838462 RepID=A0A9D2PI00_9FIRM|nr:CPBP family intramembrane glutamic endopeptidase [uncultured Anaerostipes sp.]HJC50287.1 CPBP family intramembrane metalloprotease [Candidatus Anaerostipes avistercoris]